MRRRFTLLVSVATALLIATSAAAVADSGDGRDSVPRSASTSGNGYYGGLQFGP